MAGTPTTKTEKYGQPDLKPYVGEWVVLHNDAVVEHGPELELIVEKALARGIRRPRVLYVEQKQKGVVSLGL